MNKKINVNGKEYTVREMLAIELDDINFDDKKEAIKKQVMLSTGITEVEYTQLTVNERMQIISCINEINGFSKAN